MANDQLEWDFVDAWAELDTHRNTPVVHNLRHGDGTPLVINWNRIDAINNFLLNGMGQEPSPAVIRNGLTYIRYILDKIDRLDRVARPLNFGGKIRYPGKKNFNSTRTSRWHRTYTI